MIERLAFTGNLAKLALQLNRPAEKQLLDAYHEAMMDETEPEEWREFCRLGPKRFGWKFLPSVPELVDALREFRGLPSLESEATEAYERVREASGYSPESGSVWTFRGVLKDCGRAAAEAFLEAGGHHAFATTWDESKRRERFIGAYCQVARAEPDLRLLPNAPQKALTSGEVSPGEPNETEVVQAMARIAEKATGQFPKPAKDEWEPKRVVGRDMTDEEFEKRKAELLRQARELEQDKPEVTPA